MHSLRWTSALALACVVLTAANVDAGPPVRLGLGFFPPSHYGYPLDNESTGYYGGARYREFYGYGRGYGWADYPGPVPGPMYRAESSGITPPKWLRPNSPPPPVPMHVAAPLESNGRVAYLLVHVPPDAEVWLEGVLTKQTGATRLFVSPALAAGGQYAYTVRSRWRQDGREVEQTQEVAVQPGERLTVRFPTGPELETLPTPRALPPPLKEER